MPNGVGSQHDVEVQTVLPGLPIYLSNWLPLFLGYCSHKLAGKFCKCLAQIVLVFEEICLQIASSLFLFVFHQNTFIGYLHGDLEAKTILSCPCLTYVTQVHAQEVWSHDFVDLYVTPSRRGNVAQIQTIEIFKQLYIIHLLKMFDRFQLF